MKLKFRKVSRRDTGRLRWIASTKTHLFTAPADGVSSKQVEEALAGGKFINTGLESQPNPITGLGGGLIICAWDPSQEVSAGVELDSINVIRALSPDIQVNDVDSVD